MASLDWKGIVTGVIIGGFLAGGGIFFTLSTKVAKLESEITHLKSSGLQKSSVSTSSIADSQKKGTQLSKESLGKGLRTKLNMTKAVNENNIQVSPQFHIEWDTGPASKVFQVYKDENLIEKRRVRNGELVSLNASTRGRVVFKTWWDDGTRTREEVLAYVTSE